MKKSLFIFFVFIVVCLTSGYSVFKTMLRLPDTGQTGNYTSTFGEDSDYLINVPYFINNANGIVTDTVTGLMWQKSDGGEMTFDKAVQYCDTLTLGGYTDWRLPNAHESFSILNHQNTNPALDLNIFTTTIAEYWWTSVRQANDTSKVWVTNAGGGIGNHLKTETISAGGTKRYHVRAVRNINTPLSIANQFTDNGNGTIKDNLTNLVWQKIAYADSLTWEQALTYADTLSIGGFTDWRLPNIKEIHSINDETIVNPSVNATYFTNIGIKKYWSSTSLPNQTTRAWYFDTQFGITTYDLKTSRKNILCVRGNTVSTGINESTTTVNFNLSVYPNPFTSKLSIKTDAAGKTFELFNCLGQVIYSGKNIEAQNFSYLPFGIYFLREAGKPNTLLKLIKQ